MASSGLYRRKLPSPPAIDFASPEGKKLFTEAIHNGTMEGFFKLISNFQTQSEPAYCGLATLAMVLNALAIDPCRKWKGPWRWYDESMLDSCEPLEKIKAKGISFGKVVCLAHCAGAKVESFRTNKSSIDEFRKYVVACTTSEDYHLISSYHRGAFQQTGSGHFSPIGGYHAESDMVLILDVARFKYPPHWVPLQLLWEAMDTVDQSTNLHRGFMLVSIRNKAPLLLYTLIYKHESWIRTAKYLTDDVPVMLSSDNLKKIIDVLSTILFSMPSDFTEFIKEARKKEDGGQEENRTVDSKNEVLKLVRETNLYRHVCDANNIQPEPEIVASSNIEEGVDVLTALILALPSQTWSVIKDVHVSQEIFPLVSIEDLPTLLQEEIFYLRSQLLLLKRCKDSWTGDYPETG